MKELLNLLEWVSVVGMLVALTAKLMGWLPKQKAYFYVVLSCGLGMVIDGIQGYIGDLVISALLTLFWIGIWRMSKKEDDDDDDGIPEEEEEPKVTAPVVHFETRREVASYHQNQIHARHTPDS